MLPSTAEAAVNLLRRKAGKEARHDHGSQDPGHIMGNGPDRSADPDLLFPVYVHR